MKKRTTKKKASIWRLKNCSRWQTLSRLHLAEKPVCERCKLSGIFRAATEVDHIRPVRKFPGLAYERSNLQSLCKSCHSTKTMRYERNGIYHDFERQTEYRLA